MLQRTEISYYRCILPRQKTASSSTKFNSNRIDGIIFNGTNKILQTVLECSKYSRLIQITDGQRKTAPPLQQAV